MCQHDPLSEFNVQVTKNHSGRNQINKILLCAILRTCKIINPMYCFVSYVYIIFTMFSCLVIFFSKMLVWRNKLISLISPELIFRIITIHNAQLMHSMSDCKWVSVLELLNACSLDIRAWNSTASSCLFVGKNLL